MNKYIRTTVIFMGVWFIAGLLNGLLSGLSIALLDSSSVNEAMGNLMLSVVFSFGFSVPLTGLVWLVTIIAQLAEKKGFALFQMVLGTAMTCSAITALVFINTLGKEFMNARYIAAAGIVFSAMTAVLVFRKQIKANA